jgi:RNA polymerase sigma factor (sigma-70 family)
MKAIEHTEVTGRVETLIERLKDGDTSAREELIVVTTERMRQWTTHFKKDYRNHPLAQTEDVFQNAVISLWKALESVEINDAQHYFRLAAKKIRQELLDLSRQLKSNKYNQRHLESLVNQSDDDEDRSDFLTPAAKESESADPTGIHEIVEGLPDEEREIVDLLYYHGFKQVEAAKLLDVDVRTIRRRWRKVRMNIMERLEPGSSMLEQNEDND